MGKRDFDLRSQFFCCQALAPGLELGCASKKWLYNRIDNTIASDQCALVSVHR